MRPPVGWRVAIAVVGMYVAYGAVAAGFVTVAIVLAFHLPDTLGIIVWVALGTSFGLLAMRSRARDWYDWLVHGRSQRRESNLTRYRRLD
jgi:hypothetical protein